MKRLLLCFLLVISFRVHAQTKPVFLSDGKGFLTVEKNEIVITRFPDLSKSVLVNASQIKTTESTNPLTVKSITLSADNNKILIFTNTKKVWRYETKGDYYVYNLTSQTLKKLGEKLPASSLMFAKFSPDGSKAAYVSNHNIYVEDLENHILQQLTYDGTDKIINGTFDWAYEEEFGCRDGFRWNETGTAIAFWQIDATEIKNFLLINNTDSLYSFTIPVQYPKVGENPSACRIGVVNIASSKIAWMKIPGDSKQHYLPRMEWIPKENKIIVQQLNRKQNESKLFVCDAATNEAVNIFKESYKAWIDIKSRWNNGDPAGWEWLNDKNDFIWISEMEGWRKPYVLSINGKIKNIMKDDFDLITLYGIDKKNQTLFFSASPSNATESYLYKLSVKGNKPAERITTTEFKGTNNYTFSPDCKYAEQVFSNVVTAPQSAWINMANNNYLNQKPKVNTDYGNIKFITVTTDEGVSMDAYMMLPDNYDTLKKYPTVFYVYGEPGATTVTNSFNGANNFIYYGNMQQDGYIHISIDNRGTPAPKGSKWRKIIYRNIGRLNIHDQAMAAKKLMQEYPIIDEDRIAVWGWSGGGSTTLNLLFQYPEIYQTGIAIAPVTNMLTYDNIYEERYMGVPWEAKDDYIKGSPLSYVSNFKGRLLLIHGTGDDNVHFQNTELLINELIRKNKLFNLMIYPNRTHSISEGGFPTILHLSNTATNFLKTWCKPGPK